MAKEFDIYLNKLTTVCDIIVHSLPVRGSLSGASRLILESCLKSYTLQKFIALESGSVLVSHIDEMIEVCLGRLNGEVLFDSHADAQARYFSGAKSAVELSSEQLASLVNVFEGVESAIQIAAETARAELFYPAGGAQSALILDSKIEKEYIEKHETIEYITNILSLAAESLERFLEPDANALEIASELEATIIRYRMLFEMDDDELSSYDEMSLTDVSYITL